MRRLPQGMVGGSWLAVCVLGSYLVMQYEFVPGRVGPARQWPADTMLARASTTTVVAFLHPRCVCTSATVKNLVQTLQTYPEAHLIATVFVPPDAASLDGARDSLRSQAEGWQDNAYVRTIRQALPQAEIVFDPGAVEATRFGALTSGTVLVYDANGTELFRGGITDRRGGERENPGLLRFASLVTTSPAGTRAQSLPGTSSSPVFGCPLVNESQEVAP